MEELKQEMLERGLGGLFEALSPYAKNAVYMELEEDSCATGGSKMGGEPDLPAGMEWPRKGDRPSRTLPVAPVICVAVIRSARCTFVEQRACSLHCADGAAISQVMTAPRLRRLKEIKMCAHRVWGRCALAERAPSRFW